MYRSSISHTPYGAWRHGGATAPTTRLWVAWTLRRISAQLSLAARQLAMSARLAPRVAPAWTQVEFHAEAGALEGALFIDGEYVGSIDVARL